MVKRFFESKRSGLYLAVIREGEVENGDAIEFHRETGNRRDDYGHCEPLHARFPGTKSFSERHWSTRPTTKLKDYFENAFGMPILMRWHNSKIP